MKPKARTIRHATQICIILTPFLACHQDRTVEPSKLVFSDDRPDAPILYVVSQDGTQPDTSESGVVAALWRDGTVIRRKNTDRCEEFTLVSGQASTQDISEFLDWISRALPALRSRKTGVPFGIPGDYMTVRLSDRIYTFGELQLDLPWNDKLTVNQCESHSSDDMASSSHDKVIWQATSLLFSMQLANPREVESIPWQLYNFAWRGKAVPQSY